MTTLHPLSHGSPLSEFDIFSVPPTQLSVVQDVETEHRPMQPMSADRLVQFEFTTAPNEYVKWSDTELYIKLRIKLTPRVGSPEPAFKDWGEFALEQNFMHTIIQSLDLSINGRVVTKSSINYAYRAYIDNLIGYSADAKNGHMTAILWTEPTTISATESPRHYPKKKMSDTDVIDHKYGEYFEMRGKLCLDLAQQGRAMLGGCTYKVEIRFNKPEMAFFKRATLLADPDWEISTLSLIVHRTIVSDGTVAAHMRALQHATAKYPVTRHEVQAVTINSGLTDVMLDRIFTGQLPRRVLVGFVEASAYRGDWGKYALSFNHANICHLSFNIDGRSYPRQPYMPDFSKKLYMREYYSFIQSFNQDTSNPVSTFPYDSYILGKTFFCYNFAPDLGDGCGFGGCLNLIKRGTFGMHVRFETAPKVPYIAIVFAEFDNLIQIDKNLQVTTDYLI